MSGRWMESEENENVEFKGARRVLGSRSYPSLLAPPLFQPEPELGYERERRS
jgi:hypothetical protein